MALLIQNVLSLIQAVKVHVIMVKYLFTSRSLYLIILRVNLCHGMDQTSSERWSGFALSYYLSRLMNFPSISISS